MDRRRIGWMIPKSDQNLDINIAKKDFTEEGYKELTEITSFIYEIRPIRLIFKSLNLAFSELVGFEEKIKEQSTIKKLMYDFDEEFVTSILRINSFLSSSSCFLSCTSKKIIEVFGKNSQQIDVWNSLRNLEHKTNFSYRLLYELRNYSQHEAIPISRIQIKKISEEDKRYEYEIIIKRDDLIQSKFKMNSKVKAEINNLEEEFDIVEHVWHFNNSLKKIYCNYLSLFQEKISECCKYLTSLRSVYKIPNECFPVIFIGNTLPGQPAPRKTETLPFKVFNEIFEDYVQCLGGIVLKK